MRPTFALINLSNLIYNFLNIRKSVKSNKVMAVVKADAYGHGVIQCAEALLTLKEKKPDYFGVALFEEGIELRKNNVKEPLLCFEPLSYNDINEYIKNDIEATVCTHETIKKLAKYNGSKIRVHVNIDTGMGRLGIRFNEAHEAILKLSANRKIIISGVYTHFATSDENDKYYAQIQLERFKEVTGRIRESNINCGLIHAANSGAILDMPEAHFDMVRPGISLYGYYPSQETTESIRLKPVMSLISQVDSLKDILKNDSVSYGRKFIAKVKTRSATLPIGYADGLNRNLTNSIKAIIKGKLYNQVGRVTMDRISFNVRKEQVKVGDKAILIGRSKGEVITAWDWCKILNTIPYEITCGISKRVPRIYKWN